VDFLTLTTPSYRTNGPRRFGNIVAFRLQLMRHAKALCAWHPDAVIASSTHPMDVRPALRVARQSNALLVHEVHDLWPLTPKLLGGMPDSHPVIRWMQREEDLACRQSDLVVSILPGTLPYLRARGLNPARWVHVSNGVPAEAVRPSAQPLSDDSLFRVGYFGSHCPSDDLVTLIDAASILRHEPIEFHLWGSGPQKGYLQHRAHGLDGVRFHDAVGPTEARDRMREMDALFMAVRPSPLYEYGIGLNKMFEYMAAGRPIIQAIDTPASPAEVSGCAIRCTPSSPEDLTRTITQLVGMPLHRRSVLGEAGREYVLDRATHPMLAAAFISAMDSSHSPRRSSKGAAC
jgi:glycosyltransferase involved in cell wall biosynthesis